MRWEIERAAVESARMTTAEAIREVRIERMVVGRPWISPIATVMITSLGDDDGAIWVGVKLQSVQRFVEVGSAGKDFHHWVDQGSEGVNEVGEAGCGFWSGRGI
jgi:hypothetical protein